jgi:hypothetical protein
MKRKTDESAEQAFEIKRAKDRTDEYHESFCLLLELVNQEPTLAQAFRIIESKILHGVLQLRVNNIAASPAFLEFATAHYIPFCKQAIRAMFTYGFVPWHFRHIRSGDIIPEVLPAGTFTWSIIQGTTANTTCDYGDDASKTLLYDIKLSNTGNNVKREDVFIYESTAPTWNIAQGSRVSSSYPSPLSHLIPDYKNLRVALKNSAYADAWNSHAHIITKQQTKTSNQDPSSTFLEAGVSASDPVYTYENAQLQLHSRDDDIQNMFNKKATPHMPYVYTLPMDVSLEPTLELKPCVDIPFLDARFKNDVSSLTGIPSELLAGRGSSNESSARTRTSTHQFHAAMDSIAQQLQHLLKDVYRRAYHSKTDHRPRGQSWSTALSSEKKAPSSEKKNGESPETVHHPLPKDANIVNTTDKMACEAAQLTTKTSRKPPSIQWLIEVAPPIEMDTVDDLVKLAAIEGALNPFELRRIVQMLLYGKGTAAGSASNLCTLTPNTNPATDKGKPRVDGLPKEALIMPKPKVDSPKKKS